MKVSDIDYGRASLVEVSFVGECSAEAPFAPLSEVLLLAGSLDGSALLRIGDQAWEVKGTTPHNNALLKQVLLNNVPRASWLAKVEQDPAGNVMSVVLEVREFPSVHVFPEPLDFGVDEGIVDELIHRRKKPLTVPEVVLWLTENTIIAGDGSNHRILLSGRPSGQYGAEKGFRVHGKGIAVDIARSAEDKLKVVRVVEERHPVTSADARPVFLARGYFSFSDYSTASRFRGEARSQLDQLVENADSYLHLWQEYNKIESKHILNRAREFRWIHYRSCSPLPDGRWRFQLSKEAAREDRIRLLQESESLDLEAGSGPPPELVGEALIGLGEGADYAHSGGGRVFAGEYVGYDPHLNTLDILPPTGFGGEESPAPPDKGVLFISLSGDRKRLDRRERACSKIVSAECEMPWLGLLLEGREVPERRRKYIKPLSPTVRGIFPGEPTQRQIMALDVALNTPDIALIQGPPGTGKTKVIAALQARLAEVTETATGIAGCFLLTSYQHDAVEVVANATQVLGLPALKVGKRRGNAEGWEGFDRWRRKRIDHARSQLALMAEAPASLALRRCRDIAIGYNKAAFRSEDVPRLLREVRELSEPYVAPSLQDGLLEMELQLKDRKQISDLSDPDTAVAIRSVRGLRTDITTFADDGPRQSLKAQRCLQPLGILTHPEEQLLLHASEWRSAEAPPFLPCLAELQQTLLDRLLPDMRPINAPAVNADVELLLNSVVNAVRTHIRSTPTGIESVLQEYRDDLELDAQGTREAVEQYTAVLAATCQQSVGYRMSRLKSEVLKFDNVIVDEAARANPLDLFIPMALAAHRIVLVGDHRQLPHILEPEVERELDQSSSPTTEEMLRKSLFWRLFNELRRRENADSVKRTVTLDVQYRMHPSLGRFVSETFYPSDEKFRSGYDGTHYQHNLNGYGSAVAAWKDISIGRGPEKGRQSKYRPAEAKWIAEEAKRIGTERSDFSIGVIAMYAAQVSEILRAMEAAGLSEQDEIGKYIIKEAWRETRDQSGDLKERLRVGTVDAFQGKEFDVVLLSLTRSNDVQGNDVKSLRRKYGYLMLENRLCVAMSRQQRLLIVAGDPAMVNGEQAVTAVPALAEYYKFCGGLDGTRIS